MNDKYFRNYVISLDSDSTFIRIDEDGNPSQVGDLLNAHFFYDKDTCIKFAKNNCKNINTREVKVVQLLIKAESVSEIIIR